MSVTSGFYNSLNGDRRYNAEQMSAIFDGIINDGVYASIGTAFAVSATTGNIINIGVGRAWFYHTWVYNDAILSLTAEAPDVVLNRYDTVVIEVNHSDAVRDGTIKIVKGVGATDIPTYPTLINNDTTHQIPIAYIYRPANSSEITQSDITYNVGTDECPYVTGPLEVHSVENIIAQWRSQFYDWLNELDVVLSDDAATNLAARILSLENQISSSQIHRSNFRGENLGSEVTTEQWAAIRDGSFRNIFVGDYWEINGVKWRIVDFDYWYGTGDGTVDSAVTKHHVVIMPDGVLTKAVISNEWNTGSLADNDLYANSSIRVTTLAAIKTDVEAIFGEVLSHREYMAVEQDNSGGVNMTYAWYDATVELPTEVNIYGRDVFNDDNYYSVNKTQFALFRIMSEFIANDGYGYWLRPLHGTSYSPMVESPGLASEAKRINSRGVRPVFAIC